ncbi:BlaI/MecI/CopY family transcriptional regulator [Verrucomicrobia bacterium]|jgi:BlaI family transcriptional regulator, penicillinase repressor|nr:hypothetical protein [Verrucomicrobiota bacterium]MDB4798261.1 BlaI/MecI/CopY family transcriptional regulator [Verrucomicrobiota bacterium]
MQPDKLPAAERDVLAALTQLQQATVRQIKEELRTLRPMEHASVLTLLNRLEAKHLVRKSKAPVGKAFLYEATKASALAYRGLIKDLFQGAFGGNTNAFMRSFFETKKPSANELDELENLLKELRSQQPTPKSDSQ